VGGAHGIKLTEACLREHALAPDPTFLATAQDASASLTHRPPGLTRTLSISS
jgi:hypothetical protein